MLLSHKIGGAIMYEILFYFFFGMIYMSLCMVHNIVEYK